MRWRSEVVSQGSWPREDVEEEGRVLDVARRRARSGRGSWRTPPVRTATRGRRWASCPRHRRARPVGGSIPRCRTPARAGRTRRPPRRRSHRCCLPGTRSMQCGLRVGPKAEFSVELPMANSSMLVLPRAIAPAARRSSTTVASYGRPPAFEDPRATGGRDPPRAQVVLQRHGHPGQRTRIPTAAPRRHRPRRPGPAPRRPGPPRRRGPRRRAPPRPPAPPR